MPDETDDLPRYTWVGDSMGIRIMRRIGVYGQEGVIVLTQAGPSKRAAEVEMKEIANAVCEYLDRRDRERQGS